MKYTAGARLFSHYLGLIVIGSLVVACEPAPTHAGEFRIGVPVANAATAPMPEDFARVVAAGYQGALEKQDTTPERLKKQVRSYEMVDIDARQRILALYNGEVDLTFGCAGELLAALNPGEARRLSRWHAAELRFAREHAGEGRAARASAAGGAGGEAGVDEQEWTHRVHAAVQASLPAGFATSDAGVATPCSEKKDGLPENLVAVFKTDRIDRYDRTATSHVAGGVTMRVLETGDFDA